MHINIHRASCSGTWAKDTRLKIYIHTYIYIFIYIYIIYIYIYMYTYIHSQGFMFWNLGERYQTEDIIARFCLLFFVAAFLVFMSVSVMPVYLQVIYICAYIHMYLCFNACVCVCAYTYIYIYIYARVSSAALLVCPSSRPHD